MMLYLILAYVFLLQNYKLKWWDWRMEVSNYLDYIDYYGSLIQLYGRLWVAQSDSADLILDHVSYLFPMEIKFNMKSNNLY